MAAKKKSLVARAVAWLKRGLLLAVLLAVAWFGAPVAFAAWRARAALKATRAVSAAYTA